MAKNKDSLSMGEVLAKWKKSKWGIKIFGAIFFLFPFVPPYFLYYDSIYIQNFTFDPRDSSQLPYFFGYLCVYYLVFLVILSKIADKNTKRRKEIIEKGILLGCPLELTRLSSGNSYRSVLLMNQASLDAFVELEESKIPQILEESITHQEPYVLKVTVAASTSGKFLERTIPYYARARKIGDRP